MLGHRDIKTTQHYAKVLGGKIGRNMAVLERKLIKDHLVSTSFDAVEQLYLAAFISYSE